MGLLITTEPASEPVTAAQLKTQVKIPQSVTQWDDELTRIGTAAREMTEQITRRAWINQTWKLTFSRFPDERFIQLPRPPLVSVTSLTYVDSNNVSQTLVENTDFVKRTNSKPGMIVLARSKSWPTTEPEEAEAVTIIYVAGYGASASSVPGKAKQAILALAGYWWTNPEKRDVPDFIMHMLSSLHCGMKMGAYEVTR